MAILPVIFIEQQQMMQQNSNGVTLATGVKYVVAYKKNSQMLTNSWQ